MSWSLSISNASRVDAADRIRAAVPTGQDDLPDERDEQVFNAKEAAISLVESGAIGGGTVNVSIYGHANPGHRPRAGFSNDVVTVSVSSADVAEPAPA